MVAEAVVERAYNTIRAHHMLEPGDKVLIAVSGGADSMCLLHVLLSLRSRLSLSLHALHIDHSLREQSADEAEKVRRYCEQLGVPCAIERISVADRRKQYKESTQMAARALRYDALNRVAKVNRTEKIAVGHTADDQIETVLMHLLRGSGSSGLAGIPPVRGHIVRPLFHVWRHETHVYCQEESVPYIVDPTNVSHRYERNRIRHHLVPLLEEQYNPRMKEALLRMSDLIREDERYLHAETERIFYSEALQGKVEKECVWVLAKGLADLHLALARRVLRYAYRRATGRIAPTFERLEAALALRNKGTRGGAIIQLGDGVQAVRKGSWIKICTEKYSAQQ